MIEESDIGGNCTYVMKIFNMIEQFDIQNYEDIIEVREERFYHT